MLLQSTVGATFPEFTLKAPTTAILLNTGAGNDTVNVNGVDAIFTGNLTISGADRDIVHLNSALSLNELVVTATMIDVNAPLSLVDGLLKAHSDVTIGAAIVSGAGGFDAIAGRSILVNADVSVTGANSLTLTANAGTSAGIVDANRDAGAAVIIMTPGTSLINTTGTAITVLLDGGEGLTNNASGEMTICNINASAHVALSATNGSILDGNAQATNNLTANSLTASAAGSIQLDVNVVTVQSAVLTGAGGSLFLRDVGDGMTVTSALTVNGILQLIASAGNLTVASASAGSDHIHLQAMPRLCP